MLYQTDIGISRYSVLSYRYQIWKSGIEPSLICNQTETASSNRFILVWLWITVFTPTQTNCTKEPEFDSTKPNKAGVKKRLVLLQQSTMKLCETKVKRIGENQQSFPKSNKVFLVSEPNQTGTLHNI